MMSRVFAGCLICATSMAGLEMVDKVPEQHQSCLKHFLLICVGLVGQGSSIFFRVGLGGCLSCWIWAVGADRGDETGGHVQL